MGRGLDMLGAIGGDGTGLAGQYIIVNVKHVDVEKLKKSLGTQGIADAGLGLALTVVDSQPKMALDIGLPIARNYLRDLGIDTTLSTSLVSPQSRNKSEFVPGMLVGVAGAGVIYAVGWTLWKTIFQRFYAWVIP